MFVLGLVVGVTILPIAMGVQGIAQLVRYLLAVRALRRGNHLPQHPARFLDWAYTVGLLRLAGTATQFRHRDLQAHFTNHMSTEFAK